MSKSSMICAGIDTGKRKLDVAIEGCCETLTVGNDREGHAALSSWLHKLRVKRVGIEASGGYEAAVVAKLRRDGFVVIVFQPAQVRAYAKFHRQRAKNDKIDASLIAACTAATRTIHAAPDPRLAALARHLTLIEQLTDDIARLKTRRESCHGEARLRQFWTAEIARLTSLLRHEIKLLLAAIRHHDDLAKRLDLIASVEGVGLRTAAAVLLRMPEIGRLNREHVAALAGLAPYDDDSGDHRGVRHIAGGRWRLRQALYAAALPAAFRWNRQLIALDGSLQEANPTSKLSSLAPESSSSTSILWSSAVPHGSHTPEALDLGSFVRPTAVPSSRPYISEDAARSRRQGWPLPQPSSITSLARPRLDDGEHGVMLVQSAPT